jgi:putative membrane protein
MTDLRIVGVAESTIPSLLSPREPTGQPSAAPSPFRHNRCDDGPVIAAPSLPPIDPGSMLGRWSLSPLPLLGCVAAGIWYVAAARRARARGAPIGRRRAVAFGSGLAVVFIALCSAIDTYADVSFTVHMAQHLLLSFVAPPLLALGAPIALAMRASPPERARRVSAALRSGPVRVFANPVVGFALFAGVPFVLHLSPVYDLALRDAWVHALEHVVLLAVGLVYWWPLVGGDPMPHRPSHAARVVSLVLLLPAQAFLALTLFVADAPLYPTYASAAAPFGGHAALGDQRTAAALMWVFGAIFTISAALVVAARWRTDEEARQRRIDALEVTSPPRGASRSA